jgi:hypothetical protein
MSLCWVENVSDEFRQRSEFPDLAPPAESKDVWTNEALHMCPVDVFRFH